MMDAEHPPTEQEAREIEALIGQTSVTMLNLLTGRGVALGDVDDEAWSQFVEDVAYDAFEKFTLFVQDQLS